MEENLSIFSQVMSCTSSEAAYSKKCEGIFKELSERPKGYIKDFLLSIEKILDDVHTPYLQKFLALQLLVNSTETNNLNLMKQLARSYTFINKLFHCAQFDKYRPLEEKGKNFFSENPSEKAARLGNNYLRLVLEAFRYWNEQYGTTNVSDALHCFYVINNTLTQQTEMPKIYVFVHKSPHVKNLKLKPNQPSSNYQAGISESLKTNEAYWQVIRCISSGENYQKYSNIVFEEVEKQSVDYNSKLLEAFTEIISGLRYNQVFKFHALYLLVKLTETDNNSLIAQLAREHNLLNKIYNQAKNAQALDNNKTKDLKDHELYERKFDRLILEGIKFWNIKYGSSDINSPFYHFRHLYSVLNKKVPFPSKFIYITQSNQHKDEKMFHETDDPIMRLVKAYSNSGLDFRDGFPTIISILFENPKVKSENYLQGTFEILDSSEALSITKFYTLYLLAQTTQSKNEVLISALAETKNLLGKLFKDVQFNKTKPIEQRGTTFFSTTPTEEEAILGCNYLQLMLELIKFWDNAYGVENQRNPNHIFKELADEVFKRGLPFKGDYFYIGRSREDIEDEFMKKFEFVPFWLLPSSSSNLDPLNNSITNNSFREDHFSLEDFHEKLDILNHSKNVLIQFLETHKIENTDNSDMLDILVQKVTSNYNDEVHPFLRKLVNREWADIYSHKNLILQEGKVAEELENERLNYKIGKISFFELRKRMLSILKIDAPSFSERYQYRASDEYSTSTPELLSNSRNDKHLGRYRTDFIQSSGLFENQDLHQRTKRKAITAQLPRNGDLSNLLFKDIPFTQSQTKKQAEDDHSNDNNKTFGGFSMSESLHNIQNIKRQIPNRDANLSALYVQPTSKSYIFSQNNSPLEFSRPLYISETQARYQYSSKRF